MLGIEKATETLKSVLPFDAWQSFENPRLKDEEADFLNEEHLTEVRKNSSIVDWEYLGEETVEGVGTLRRMGFVTERGYAYSALIGIPENPASTVPIIGTSAWWTSTEGHNERTLRNLVRAGNFVYLVGAEGSYEPKERPEPKGPITLADSAAAVLNFSYYTTEELTEEGHTLSARERIVTGESRGGMVGMGIVALASEFNQDIIFADLTAPCLPQKMEIADILDLLKQVAREPGEIIKLVGNLTLARLIHYPSTIDLSPYSVLHQLAIGFALFSGEAGALARRIPKDILMHITVFENDFASMAESWNDIFKNHPDVQITPLPGSHLTLADLETLLYILGRNEAVLECLASVTPLTRETVFKAGRENVPYQDVLDAA